MINLEMLQQSAQQIGISLSEQQLQQFDQYAQILVSWNEKINLTAITKPEEIVVKHFIDSLLLLKAVQLEQNAAVIDVGTGAGFPAVPVKIARPDLQITLLDSLNKRITFLKELSQQLGQGNQCVHARAEEAGRQESYRAQYSLATARAVAHLRELSEYCLPFVKVGGRFAALKSGAIQEEVQESKKAIHLLGGKIEKIWEFQLPDHSARTIICIKKISQTATIYPRPSAKIAKKPLI
ncbi:MAG: 16S rRNA (guanine(527)-N(7))-methyltransferase RsmG [Anaerotruncus sp.]|nr:16S rRNA (guanine(527)-N(7))-methyltransferase RsmG [Anaerotruncus sp.]